jgi:hypothetical protein
METSNESLQYLYFCVVSERNSLNKYRREECFEYKLYRIMNYSLYPVQVSVSTSITFLKVN